MFDEIYKCIDEAIELINNGEHKKARSVISYIKIQLKDIESNKDACLVCFGDKYLLNMDMIMRPCPSCGGTGKNA